MVGHGVAPGSTCRLQRRCHAWQCPDQGLGFRGYLGGYGYMGMNMHTYTNIYIYVYIWAYIYIYGVYTLKCLRVGIYFRMDISYT